MKLRYSVEFDVPDQPNLRRVPRNERASIDLVNEANTVMDEVVDNIPDWLPATLMPCTITVTAEGANTGAARPYRRESEIL